MQLTDSNGNVFGINGLEITGPDGKPKGGGSGAQGVQGVQGITGIQGLVGIQGPIGTQGVTGTGIQGTDGPQGVQGVQGPSGGGSGGSTFGTNIIFPPQSGVYYSTCPFTQTSTTTTGPDFYYLAPFIPKNNLSVNELRLEVTTAIAAGLATILIFDDLNGLPKNKLLESTNLDCSTTGMKTFTSSFSFVAGTTYWIGASTNAVIGFRSNGSSFALQHHAASTAVNPQYRKSAAFGSVPSTITVFPNSDAFALQPIIIRFRAV